MLAASRRVSKQGFCWFTQGATRPLHASPRRISASASASGFDLGRVPIADEGIPSYVERDLARNVRRGIAAGEEARPCAPALAPKMVELPRHGSLDPDHPTAALDVHVANHDPTAHGFGIHAAGAHTMTAVRESLVPVAATSPSPAAPISTSSSPSKKSTSLTEKQPALSSSEQNDANASPPSDDKKLYHFEIKGAEAKKEFDRTLIKCMCHEVAAAAAERARAIFGKARVAMKDDPTPRESESARSEYVADDFCVFSHTVMRDILDAKHAKHTFWGSTHWCASDEYISKAVRQMTKANVGALLVMDRVSLDRDSDDVITEEELRAAPESGAIKGIISERDYLRAVANDDIKETTLVDEIMIDFDSNPELLISVTPECSVLAAMQIMTEHRIRHIPCISAARGTRGAKMEGMITIGDVVKALISEEREEVALCHDYIQGAYS
tara:strand:+ start:2244 stop:3569 length:1326 start_codon:yes stop_codon:yes gene_type:complete